MRVGSLVECIDNKNPTYEGSVMPVEGGIYTVRGLCGGIGGVFLEEIAGNYYYDGTEIPYRNSRFRELLPPIANIEEQIKENSLELVEE